jgi:3-isopropylmalate/(R)-2-methylmalate dehydratase small subunit
MSTHRIEGKAHVFGDDINTDLIIAGKYTKTLDLEELAAHVMEDLDPEFSKKVSKGDILVAGANFGCGSSREQAPLALKAAGISAVISRYFARIFFRNAINIGLPVLEVAEAEISQGDELSIDLKEGRLLNRTQNAEYRIQKLNDIMIDILAAGGLVNYLKRNRTYRL